MIKTIKEWVKCLSLANHNNWEMYSERGWSIEIDGSVKPRRFYRHKKYPYFITNIFTVNPLNIIYLVDKFMKEYKNKSLIMDETFCIESY